MTQTTDTAAPFQIQDRGRRFVMEGSVDDYLAFGAAPNARNGQQQDLLNDRLASLGGRERAEFYGVSDGRRVLGLRGWPEGLALAEQYRRLLPELPPLPAITRARRWSADDGDEFCRDRFDAGREECWSGRRRTTRPGKPVLRLTCAVGAPCRIKAADMAWAGAAAYAICDAAEAAGYRLEVQAIDHTDGVFQRPEKGLTAIVNVKAAHEPLDPETTVMALACPAFIRWHLIINGLAVTAAHEVCGGFGSPAPVPDEHLGDLHIRHCYSAEAAREAVATAMAKIRAMAEGDAVGAAGCN